MERRGYTLWLAFLPFLIFVVIGVGLIVAGLLVDPSLTRHGSAVRPVLFTVGGIFLFTILTVGIGISLAANAKQRKTETLLATGQTGQATILSLKDTGVIINNNPRVRVLLEVQIAGYAPYQVEKAIVVPLSRLPQVQVGSTVPVLADPREPESPDKIGLLLK